MKSAAASQNPTPAENAPIAVHTIAPAGGQQHPTIAATATTHAAPSLKPFPPPSIFSNSSYETD